MDILPLPHNPTSPTAKVPYVCSGKYDGLAFLTFPARKGRSEMVSPTFPPGAEFGMREKAHPTPIKELESLYQTWLYFGLLCEFLNINEDSPGVPPSADGNKGEELDAVYQFFTVSNEVGERVLTSLPILMRSLELWKWEGDEDTRKLRCRHLFECLRITHWMLQWLPDKFDQRIRYSIAVLAEFFNFNLGTIVVTSRWKDVQTFFGPWALGFLTKSAQSHMTEYGWCPSAVEEAKARSTGLQTLHIMSKMEKLKPKRDHSRCTKQMCVNYQIDTSNYKLSHAEEGCTCSTLEVDSNAITEILMMGESSLPLLKIIYEDDLEDLRIEIAPSSSNASYVALSHVWADGLGNPFSNSLHRCQLARLKGLVERLDTSATPAGSEPKPACSLWLDTLCCPAVDGPGKQKAIQKLRHVYQEADKVLVLDASLFSVNSEVLHTSEVLIRAYTSPWMRRLWTLQEGALNKNLYFQFADRAVSAQGMIDELKGIAWNQDARYMHPFMDMEREHLSIRSFFHTSPTAPGLAPNRHMETLESALQSRSFSVSSDEPLCIATLMSLDITKVLAIQGAEPRMREMWRMLSDKLGGIPVSIVFYEDYCLAFPGWRWAPRSFLPNPNSLFDLNARKRRWTAGSQLGLPSPRGLKCRLPGFKLRSNITEEENPFKRIYRPTETSVVFQDEEGIWYSITHSNLPNTGAEDFYERMNELRERDGWPLRQAIEEGECAIVLEKEMRHRNGLERDAFRGILVKIHDSESGIIIAERQLHVLVATLYEQEVMVQETYKSLWQQMREDELTVKLAGIEDQESEKYKEVLGEVKAKMKKIMKDALETEFLAAMPRLYGEKYDPDALWIRMANWWEQENTGVKLPSDQIWCID